MINPLTLDLMLKWIWLRLTCRRHRADPEPEEPVSEVGVEDTLGSPRTGSEWSDDSAEGGVANSVAETAAPPLPLGEFPALEYRVTLCLPHHIPDSGDRRFYAVWRIPGAPRDLRGVHWGQSTGAYNGLLGLNNNHFGGIRFRRFESLEAAIAGFQEEARRHRVEPEPVQVYRWQLREL